MIAYVSLVEAKTYARIQHTGFDSLITLLIEACSSAVKNHLKSTSAYEPYRDENDAPILDSNDEPEPFIDSNGERLVRAEVKLAVLYWVDLRLKNLDTDQANGEPPAVVKNILTPLRDPTLA